MPYESTCIQAPRKAKITGTENRVGLPGAGGVGGEQGIGADLQLEKMEKF